MSSFPEVFLAVYIKSSIEEQILNHNRNRIGGSSSSLCTNRNCGWRSRGPIVQGRHPTHLLRPGEGREMAGSRARARGMNEKVWVSTSVLPSPCQSRFPEKGVGGHLPTHGVSGKQSSL